MAKKSIFTARNPLENINTGKAKDLMKKLDNDDIIKQEVMKLDGAKLTKINKGILLKTTLLINPREDNTALKISLPKNGNLSII